MATPEEITAALGQAVNEPGENAVCVNPGAEIEALLVALLGHVGQTVREAICNEVGGLHSLTQTELTRLDTAINGLGGDSDLVDRINTLQSVIDTFFADNDGNGIFDFVDSVNEVRDLATTANATANDAVAIANAVTTQLNQFQAEHNLTVTNLNSQISALQAEVSSNTAAISSLQQQISEIDVTANVSTEDVTAAICAAFDTQSARIRTAGASALAAFNAAMDQPCPVLTYGAGEPPAAEGPDGPPAV